MRPLDIAEDGLLGLITMRGRAHGWGIELKSLLRIEPLAAWKGGAPLDLGAVFGVAGEGLDAAGRVLVIDAGSEELPVLATGAVAVRAVAWEAVYPLPPAVIGSPRARFLTGVVFGEEGRDPLVIVDVLGLGAALASAANAPSPSNPREEINA